ncbi:MAG: hypothetical protein EXR71_11480 [Myxococcales bacterium]|nr:hypothetical protein [Myxococcales bacterium]
MLVAGCASCEIDGPYVLTTGLDGARQLDWGAAPHTLVVTTPGGSVQVDGAGQQTPVAVAPAAQPPLRPDAIHSFQTSAGVVWIDAAGTLRTNDHVVLRGLREPRALICDRLERTYVVAGAPEPALYRVEGAGLVLIAEWVGPVTGVAWGPGGGLGEGKLYLVRSDGVLQYVVPPP